MPHCTKCGASIADNAAFCAACGAPQPTGAAPGPAGNPPAAGQMSENVAGLLCYVLGWLTGLILYFVDKRPYVRFHAAQSIVLFGGLNILSIVIGPIFWTGFMMGGWALFPVIHGLHMLISLATFILWVLLMIKAYQGARFRVPLVADLAEKLFGKF